MGGGCWHEYGRVVYLRGRERERWDVQIGIGIRDWFFVLALEASGSSSSSELIPPSSSHSGAVLARADSANAFCLIVFEGGRLASE